MGGLRARQENRRDPTSCEGKFLTELDYVGIQPCDELNARDGFANKVLVVGEE